LVALSRAAQPRMKRSSFPDRTQPINQTKEPKMRKSARVALLLSTLVIAGPAHSQGMLLDFAADKVLKKYAAATCEQLKAHKDEPQSDQHKMAIEFLRNDAQARVAFINKIAAPVLNKMFECGLIP
jgi:hypothetical protein